MDQQRELMKELFAQFGQNDNVNFWDANVCKCYLVEFCPNQLFINTKSDLGVCTKIHDEHVKKKYLDTPEKEKYGYEELFFEYVAKLVGELDRKIRKGRERLDVQPDEKILNPNEDEREEAIIMLDEKIKELLIKIEAAGEDGRVQEATEMTRQVEHMQVELETMNKSDNTNPLFKQDKKMEVCDVCGGFLIANDTSNRLDAHLQGKQHTGYQLLRETLEKMKKRRPRRPSPTIQGSNHSRGSRRNYGDRDDEYHQRRRSGYRDQRGYRDHRDRDYRDYEYRDRNRGRGDYRDNRNSRRKSRSRSRSSYERSRRSRSPKEDYDRRRSRAP